MGNKPIIALTIKLNKILVFTALCFTILTCKNEVRPLELPVTNLVKPIEVPRVEFGFNFNDFDVVQDTVRNGDSFGQLLFNNNLSYA